MLTETGVEGSTGLFVDRSSIVPVWKVVVMSEPKMVHQLQAVRVARYELCNIFERFGC